MRLPSFIAHDIYALDLEARLADGDTTTIHAKLNMNHICTALHVSPDCAGSLQHALYSRLLQRCLQNPAGQDKRSAVLALFAQLDSAAAETAGPAALEDDEDDVFLSLFASSTTSASASPVPTTVATTRDALDKEVRSAVEDRPAQLRTSDSSSVSSK